MKTIKDLLIQSGYDGLVCCVGDCGCTVDDLEPCGAGSVSNCVPARKKECTNCGDCEGGDFCMVEDDNLQDTFIAKILAYMDRLKISLPRTAMITRTHPGSISRILNGTYMPEKIVQYTILDRLHNYEMATKK